MKKKTRKSQWWSLSTCAAKKCMCSCHAPQPARKRIQKDSPYCTEKCAGHGAHSVDCSHYTTPPLAGEEEIDKLAPRVTSLTIKDKDVSEIAQDILDAFWVAQKPMIVAFIRRVREEAYQKGKDDAEFENDKLAEMTHYERGRADERSRILEQLGAEKYKSWKERAILAEEQLAFLTKETPHYQSK